MSFSAGLTTAAWEKIPPSARKVFTNQTATALAGFPADWPEIEYLNIAGYFGYQNNFITGSPNDGYNYASSIIALVAPLSRGNITISSADMADQPVINPNWLTDPTDVQVAIAGYKRVRQLFATKAMAPVLIGPEYFPGPSVKTDAELLHLIRQSLNTVFHAAATCSMGKTSDPKAVVDSKARVIGVKSLRVVDASAFPLLPPGHPQSTVCKTSTRPFLCWDVTYNLFFRCPCRENRRRHQKWILGASITQARRQRVRFFVDIRRVSWVILLILSLIFVSNLFSLGAL